MIVQVRALTTPGLREFSQWLGAPSGAPPTHLLTDESSSEEFEPAYSIDSSRSFSTTFDLGAYLHNEVFVGEVNRVRLLVASSMWAWISLLLINGLMRKSGTNAGKPLALPHYIDQGPRLGYRLIARTAWDLVSMHGEYSRIALGSTRSPWGEMAEQMASRQEIYGHKGLWPVAAKLYSNGRGGTKPGCTTQRSEAARRDPNNPVGLGGVRRLPFTFRQFERTFNLRRMDSDQLVGLLPREYDRWRS